MLQRVAVDFVYNFVIHWLCFNIFRWSLFFLLIRVRSVSNNKGFQTIKFLDIGGKGEYLSGNFRNSFWNNEKTLNEESHCKTSAQSAFNNCDIKVSLFLVV